MQRHESPVPDRRRFHRPEIRRQSAGRDPRRAGPLDRADAVDRRRVQSRRDDLRAAAQGPEAHRPRPDLHAEVRDAVRRPSQCRHGLRPGRAIRPRRRPLRVRGRRRPGPARPHARERRRGRPPGSPHRSRSASCETVPAEIVAQAVGLQPGDIVGEPVDRLDRQQLPVRRVALARGAQGGELQHRDLPQAPADGAHRRRASLRHRAPRSSRACSRRCSACRRIRRPAAPTSP